MFKEKFKLKTVCFIIVCLVLLVGVGVVYERSKSKTPKEEKNIVLFDQFSFIENLRKNMPGLKSVSISKTPIKGVREVVIEETGEIFYADDYGKNIFIGVWVDEKGNNLTKLKMDELAKVKFNETMKSFDKSLAIKLGSGANEVIEFTDVDCPFCLRAESFFDAPDANATRYLFLTPIDSLHPEAAKKSVHILCSENSAEEYKRVISGQVKDFIACEKGEELLKKHRNMGEQFGVQGTPQFYVNGVHYVGANPQVYEDIKKK